MPCSPAALLSPPSRGVPRLLAALRLSGLIIALVATIALPAQAINIQLDYSYDTLGFFGTASAPTPARTALEFAVRTFTPFTDTLAAIQPGGNNSWIAKFPDPSTNTYVDVPNLTVPQDTIVVFAIARDLLGSAIGQAGPGAYQFSGSNPTPGFISAVTNRGQGNSNVDFAPWGGVIAIDVWNNVENAPRRWNFDVSSGSSTDAYDFHTVATHELAHLFGFGTSTAFAGKVQFTSATTAVFNGDLSQQLYGGNVPLFVPPGADQIQQIQHWASGTTSPPFLPGTQPRASLGPSLPLGQRRLLSPLDFAALADIGWQVPPELLGLPGDVNDDAVVDGLDFLTWQRNYGGFGGSPGDANGDLRVDDFDGFMLRHYMGSQGFVPDWLAANAAVPEPAAASLALVGCFAHGVRRRRR